MSRRALAALEWALADALEERERARNLAAYLENALHEARDELAEVRDELERLRRREIRVVE